jgi:hypothetical protein
LEGMKLGSGAWAISHYNPNLKVEIIGSTIEEVVKSQKVANEVKGTIIGKWSELQCTSGNYVIYKVENKIYIKIIFKDGESIDEELIAKQDSRGVRYDNKIKKLHGEYYILKSDGTLGFYNNENKNFANVSE